MFRVFVIHLFYPFYQSEIGFGKLESYKKLSKIGSVSI